MNATSFTLCHSPTPHFTLRISSSLRRPRRNSIKPTKPTQTSPPYDQRLNFIIDVENIANRASNSFKTKLNRFISTGTEAFEDFQTLVTVDNNRRVVISCRRSSLWFLANSLIWGFVIFVVFRIVFVKFGFWRYYHGGYGNGGFVRRDRSLGGREVVVGNRRFKEREGKKKGFNFPGNPLSPSKEMSRRIGIEGAVQPRKWVSAEKELPQWWPDLVNLSSLSSSTGNYQEFQNEANRVIRAIMDNRMCGKDITEDDILQFRRICKASGAKVYIETANGRDSFYRASVDFVLNCISSANSSSVVLIDGEDARQFVAGLADSIGLPNVRAAIIVSAAVAARTRSWFLQAWALEMQGKRTEALAELSKICLIHQTFPPEESSAEMEMVAQGLEKHLRVEQRKLLLNLLAERCGPSRSAAEALGLTIKPLVVEDDTWRLIP